mgnify:FL=1
MQRRYRHEQRTLLQRTDSFLHGFRLVHVFMPASLHCLTLPGAVISGSFFVFVLAWIYKLCYKLKQENKPEQGEELIGRKCEIYTRCQEQEQAGTDYVVYIAINGAQRELTVRSIQGKSYREGDILTLKDYKEGIYYID